MPLTKHGIKAMGFKEIPSRTKIEAYFNSAALFSIEGINIKELTPESYPDLSYHNEDFHFHLEIASTKYQEDFLEMILLMMKNPGKKKII